MEQTSRRGNYDSGEDFVLEYGELRFTFNEEDFAERCEQAALKLGFVGGRLGEDELEDLVNLAVNGEIHDPASALGEHVNDCWPELVGPAERSLVHWLRRLVFRGAWLDQRVNEGELGVAFDEETGSFAYVQPDDPTADRARAASRSSWRREPSLGPRSPTRRSSRGPARSRGFVNPRPRARWRGPWRSPPRRPRRRAARACTVPLAARSSGGSRRRW